MSLEEEITLIIERSRHHEENLLTDAREAAKQIIEYLKAKGMLEEYLKAA